MRHVTHEWAGEPHASESVKRVGGAEVARNFMPTPSYEGDLGNPEANSVAVAQSFLGAYAGEYSLQITKDSSAGLARVDHNYSSLGADQLKRWVAVSFRAGRRIGTTFAQARLQFRTESGGWTGTYPGAISEVPWLSNTPHSVHVATAEVPTDANLVRVRAYSFGTLSGGEWSEGDSYRIDGWVLATADTEADALAQVETYFDGDTEDYYDDETTELFKVRANGTWYSTTPKAFLGGTFRKS